MPVVIPRILIALRIKWASLASALSIAFIFLVAVKLVRALLSPLRALPVGVGHFIGTVTDDAATYVENVFGNLLSDVAAPLSKFMASLGHELTVGYDATADFAHGVATDVGNFVADTLPKTIDAKIAPVVVRAHALEKTIYDDVYGGIHGLPQAFVHLTTRLYAKGSGDVHRLFGVVDTLTIRLYQKVDGDIHRLYRGIDDLGAQLYDRVNGDIGKLYRGIDSLGARAYDNVSGDIPNLWKWVRSFDLDGLLAKSLAFTGIATLVTTIAVEAGLENAECRRKVKGICGIDPREWESMLLGLVAIAEFPGLREMARMGADVIKESEDAFRALAD